MSRHESCWAIPVPDKERAAGIPITVSPRTCLHVLVLFCPTGSCCGSLSMPPCHLYSPNTMGLNAALSNPCSPSEKPKGRAW